MAANPLRAVLCTLGVVMGIGAVIATLALADGMQRFARAQIAAQTDVQAVTVASKTRELRDGFSYPTRRYPAFTIQDAADLGRSLHAGSEVTMMAGGQVVLTASTVKPHAVSITATLGNYLSFGRRTLLAGRYFTDVEVAHAAPIVVLSHRLAADLAPGGDLGALLGREVRVHGLSLSVIGVMPPYTGETIFQAFVPLRLAARLLGLRDRLLPTLVVRAPTLETLEATRQDVIEWAASRYRDWEQQVSITTQIGRLEQAMEAMLVMKLVLGALAGISLVVGGVGIMNVLLAGVTERTREIGVRKALGARKRDILIQFLAEAVAMSSIGTALGMAAGFTGAFGVAAIVRRVVPGADMHAAVTPATMVTAVSSAVTIGIIFGIFPALRAARLSPIDAIRHE